jgi:hypothetical protein
MAVIGVESDPQGSRPNRLATANDLRAAESRHSLLADGMLIRRCGAPVHLNRDP